MNETKSGGMTAKQYFNAHKGEQFHAYRGVDGILCGWHNSTQEQRQVVILNVPTWGWDMAEDEGQALADIIDWRLVKQPKFMYVTVVELEAEVSHAR